MGRGTRVDTGTCVRFIDDFRFTILDCSSRKVRDSILNGGFRDMEIIGKRYIMSPLQGYPLNNAVT